MRTFLFFFCCRLEAYDGRQTGLITTARLHLISLPSSTGQARFYQHTHTHTQCHRHWQVPVIKTPSYHISNYTGNCRWNWKSFGWRCTSPSLSLFLSVLLFIFILAHFLPRLWQKSVKGNDPKPIIGFRCTLHSFFPPFFDKVIWVARYTCSTAAKHSTHIIWLLYSVQQPETLTIH